MDFWVTKLIVLANKMYIPLPILYKIIQPTNLFLNTSSTDQKGQFYYTNFVLFT